MSTFHRSRNQQSSLLPTLLSPPHRGGSRQSFLQALFGLVILAIVSIYLVIDKLSFFNRRGNTIGNSSGNQVSTESSQSLQNNPSLSIDTSPSDLLHPLNPSLLISNSNKESVSKRLEEEVLKKKNREEKGSIEENSVSKGEEEKRIKDNLYRKEEEKETINENSSISGKEKETSSELVPSTNMISESSIKKTVLQQKDDEIKNTLIPSSSLSFSSPIRLLSTDFHIGPIADLKYLVSKFFQDKVIITDMSLSGACTRANTCARQEDLKVLIQGGWEEGIYASSNTKRRFFESYKDGGLPFNQDVFHCSHPTGMCEFFMPFDIPMIVWATTRFEQGREGNTNRFNGFVQNFIALASRPGTVILANNLYDVHYIKYFTGITPFYVQSHCAYPNVQYVWKKEMISFENSKREILISGFRPKRGLLVSDLGNFISPLVLAAQQANLPFIFREYRQALGENYLYSDLVRYPAILYIPYQVSIMSFYEQYNMGIPLLAPSLALLTQWHMEYLIVSERTWDTVLQNSPKQSSAISRHASVNITEEPFDPNDEFNKDAVSYWLSFSDFYHFPHIILFDSWQDAVNKLATIDLEDISRKMLQHSQLVEKELVKTWGKIFKDISFVKEKGRRIIDGGSYYERMDKIYGGGKWVDY
jgi:hypothetical protein